MRKSLIASFLGPFIFFSTLFAQQLPKTLMWRISGNGLKKSSYLYGTMHVYDPRLFNLGDSLLQAISSSEGFANELDLNQITPMLVDFVNQEINHALTLKQMFNQKTFDKYSTALTKKFNKPADEITSLDVLKERNKWIDESYKGKKMQTFLDAYLADLAYRQGKWIGGVEDFADQSGLMNAVIDESDLRQLAIGSGGGGKTEREDMVTLYQNSDLDGFQKLFAGVDSNYRDLLLVRRNRKMAFRMDSLAKIRSTVFAVGAAHLPGEEGLITLLKARGYFVTPVFYSKKIEPGNYIVPEVERSWVEVNDPEGRYKVMMPGTPGNIKVYGIMNMAMYFNIFNSTWYLTACTGLPYSQKGVDSVENEMLKQLFGSGKFKEEKLLNLNGIPGKSYILKDAGGYKKVYLLYSGSILYYAVAFAATNNVAALNAVDRFFDSFQPITVHQDLQTDYFEYTDTIAAYRISLPGKPKSVNDLVKSKRSSIVVDLMVSTDPRSGSYYFFGPAETTIGYSFQNDSATANSVHESMLGKFQDITLDTMYSGNGIRIVEFAGSMLNGTMQAKAKIIVRGNRYYTLLVMYAPGKWNASGEKVWSSFELTDYAYNKWEYKTAPDSLFTSWAPDRILFFNDIDSGETTRKVRYESYDSTRANTYSVKLDTLGKYYWIKNDSALWKEQKNEYVTQSDTVLSERIFKKDGLYQYEIFKKSKGSNNVLRMQMFLRGRVVYRLVTLQESQTISDKNVDRYFNTFHFNQSPPETKIFESGANAVLADLQSPDSSVRSMANNALSSAHFDTTDIHLLQAAVLNTYPPDSDRYISPNQAITECIIRLNDSSSVNFAREQYPLASSQEIENALLEIMSAYHSRQNYEELGKLLLASPPKWDLPNRVIGKWKDSLQVAAALFPTILPLLHDSALAPSVIDIAGDLVDSNLISFSIFSPWQGTILKYSDQRYRSILKDSLNFSMSDYALIGILEKFNNILSNAMLKKWLGVKGNPYHKQQIVLALLENKQPVSQKVLQELAANRYTRIELYKNLKKYNRSSLFPAKYLTQSYFAESLAEDAASGFSDDEADVRFIKEKELKWKGKTVRFFFYDVFLEESNEHWLAVSGPFNLNRTDISLAQASSEIYQREEYDVSNAENQMKTMVEEMGREQ
jgi:uncharacterized protein YbaP (TraB family)